jgi:hypothetical protein
MVWRIENENNWQLRQHQPQFRMPNKALKIQQLSLITGKQSQP